MGKSLDLTEKNIRKISCVLVEGDESFWMAKYPITKKQYGAKKSIEDNHPVVGVTWIEAKRFAKKLGGFLPTEAQWEWAARGGKESKGYIYSGSNDINEVAWHSDNGGNKTHAVGQKKPNELGIFDMSGNVWEWCEDQFVLGVDAEGNKKYKADYARVRRGGSYKSTADGCKVTHRNSLLPADSNWHTGFRVCFPYDDVEADANYTEPAPKQVNVTEKQAPKHRKVNIVEKRHWAIIEEIEKNCKITTSEMAKILKITRMTIHRDLEKLKAADFIKRIGSDNGGYWKVFL
jgi:hypothetical protein